MNEFEEENIRIGPLFATVGAGTFFVVAIIFALTGLHETMQQSITDEWASKTVPDAAANATEQAERLGTYGVVDAKKGRVRVPIDRAMKLILEERSQD